MTSELAWDKACIGAELMGRDSKHRHHPPHHRACDLSTVHDLQLAHRRTTVVVGVARWAESYSTAVLVCGL